MLYFTVHHAEDLMAQNQGVLDQTTLDASVSDRQKQMKSSRWTGFSKSRQYEAKSVSFAVVNILTNESLLQVSTCFV